MYNCTKLVQLSSIVCKKGHRLMQVLRILMLIILKLIKALKSTRELENDIRCYIHFCD